MFFETFNTPVDDSATNAHMPSLYVIHLRCRSQTERADFRCFCAVVMDSNPFKVCVDYFSICQVILFFIKKMLFWRITKIFAKSENYPMKI